MDDDAAPVRALARKRAINYPVIMGDDRLGALYGGVLGLPVTFLIDRQGVIAAKFQGETKPATLEARIRDLLRKH
jgi:peroxiredoxin